MAADTSGKNALPGLQPRTAACHAHIYIGGKWRLGLIWCLRNGCRRFGELRKDLGIITDKMLMQELRELELLQVVNRSMYPELPPKVEYALTERGRSLLPVVEHILSWSATDMQREAEAAQVPERPAL